MARQKRYELPENHSSGEHVRTESLATVSIRCMDRSVWKEFRDLCYALDMQSPDVFAMILAEYLKGTSHGDTDSRKK